MGDATGKHTIRTPPFTINLSADYSVPVGTGDLGFNVTYFYNSGFYWEPDGRVRESDYNILNGLVSFTADAGWRISAYVRNLTRQKYHMQVSNSTLGDGYAI